MLKISANTDNTIWVNASRNKTLSNPTYLMSLEHRVSGDRTYFIPQNITSFSGSTAYDPRVDVFKFGVYETGVNLTGGTRAWYWQTPPNVVNDDAKLKGTGKSYPVQTLFLTSGLNIFTVWFDWEDVNDRMDDVNDTGFTVTLNDIVYTGITEVFRDPKGGGIDRASIGVNPSIIGFPLNQIEKISYTGTTTGGTSLSNTIYIANWEELRLYEPWRYYGDSSPNSNKSYPITYLGETSINLKDYGWYYYRIYEQTSQTNLNPSLATNIVDEGTLYLYPPPPDEVSYTGYSTSEITIYDEDKVPTYHILQENEYHLLTENNELLRQE